MNTLIVKSERDSFEKIINDSFIKNGDEIISIESIVKEHRGILKILSVLKALILVKRRNDIKKIIVFDDTTVYLISCILFKETYLWLWNTLPVTLGNKIKIPLCKIKKKVYTFDEGDSKEFGFKINSQFLPIVEIDHAIKQQDVYFVGADKGRYDLVKKLYVFFSENNITNLFQMIPEKGKTYIPQIVSQEFVEYNDVLQNIYDSKVILDICKKGQVGATYRVMEAMLFDKKIITNNESYKALPFYSPEKIFVLENNNYNKLIDFINSKEIKFSKAEKEYYSIENWIRRFE